MSQERPDVSAPEPGPNYSVVSTPHTRKRRGFETARDMVWSMTAIVGVLAVILLLNYRPDPAPIREVDWRPVVIAARESLEWPVLAPSVDLPGWQATSARNERASGEDRRIHIGWVTGQGAFVALQQTTLAGSDLRSWLRLTTQRGRPDEQPSWTDGRERVWERSVSEDGTHRSLVSSAVAGAGDQVTYVVGGTATWAELEQLADSLRPE
jgi:hypothetical protein